MLIAVFDDAAHVNIAIAVPFELIAEPGNGSQHIGQISRAHAPDVFVRDDRDGCRRFFDVFQHFRGRNHVGFGLKPVHFLVNAAVQFLQVGKRIVLRPSRRREHQRARRNR